jgi:putative DNA primase/helicase
MDHPPPLIGLAILDLKYFMHVGIPPKRMILHPWLSEQSITLISGYRGTGKTWFAMSLLDAITKGRSFGPWEIRTSVPCCYLEGEMSAHDVKERFTALNFSGESINPLFIYSDAFANYLGLGRANLIDPSWRDSIKRFMLSNKIKLWVIDNISSLTRGIDENSKKEWDPINAWLLELRFAGISTILLHHTNREGSQRGTSSREDNIDISILLKRPKNYKPEDGARFVVHFEKARVPNKDLGLISDIEFHLTFNEYGQVVWTWGNAKKEVKKEVIKMLGAEFSPAQIAENLNITKGYISQIKKSAISDGLFDAKCKLTHAGILYIS